MTKPVGYFVSGHSIDLLTRMYGAYLEKLTREQLVTLLFLAVDQMILSYNDFSDADGDVSNNAWLLVEAACAESDDTALGLIEAIVSQLRYPVGTANEKAIDTPADRPL